MKFTTQTTTLPVLLLLTLVNADGDYCIHLKGDKKYTWHADGDFTGSGQIDNKPHCFGPGSGGISIGHPEAATKGAPGNTRLECHFPEDETDADFCNCNISLVDGFSAAVTCSVGAKGGWPNSNDPSAPLGCGYDVGSSCPDHLWDDKAKNCKNDKGASVSSLDAVAPAFQVCGDSKENPNSAEVYFSMQGAYKFEKSDGLITCTVGKGEAPKKEKRAVEAHHHSFAGPLAHAHHQRRRNVEGVRALKTRSLGEALS